MLGRSSDAGARRPLSSTGKSILGLAGHAEAKPADKEKQAVSQAPAAASASSTTARSSTGTAGRLALAQPAVGPKTTSNADKDVSDALKRLFSAFDEDGDGLLSALEFAAARRALVKEPKPAAVDAGGSAKPVGSDDFVSAMTATVSSLQISSADLVQQINKLISGRLSGFDKSVSDIRHAVVRNVSCLPEESVPAPKALWRTSTGRGAFELPPGVSGGPLMARIAFKVMQYMAMRTEDATVMDGDLVARVAGHRETFKKLLDRAGEIVGAQVLPSSSGKSVDLYLMKPPAVEMFHVCLQNVQLGSGPDPVVEGIGGFDVGSIEAASVPPELLGAMCQTDLCRAEAVPSLLRKLSKSEVDWQNAPLVLTATPAARHIIRIRFSLVGNELSSQYIVFIPKLRTVLAGHARYASHRVSVKGLSDSSRTDFPSFVLANVRGEQLRNLEVEHEFVNQQVRVQQKESKAEDTGAADVVPVPVLSATERASSLACEGQAIRSLLSRLGLARSGGERDVAYAMRLGRELRHGYEYDVKLSEADLQRLPTLIWETRRGDCSAFNAGFVFALRAHQIPARISLGFKYGQAVRDACGSVVAPHAQCEFFAEGIGWIPCDATAGVHRLGHEAAATLSFLEFRPASITAEELQDLRKVLGPTAVPELKAEPDNDTEQARLSLAENLGKFRDFCASDPLTDTARAGAKMFEGGPFKGQPLKLGQLNEIMLIPAEIDAIMDHLKARPRAEEWSKMWPYGVISCSYEFEQGRL